MRATVKKWGNSAAVRIPASVMQATQLDLDALVEVREEAGRIVIEPVRQKTYELSKLLKGITSKNQHQPVDFWPSHGERGLVMAPRYVPQAGDIVWLNFTPQAGHEQAGHRPALVLSPAAYNDKTSLMICCPMTRQIKNYPFEVLIAGTPANVVLADQVKSLNWRVRKATRKRVVSREELADVRAKILALIG